MTAYELGFMTKCAEAGLGVGEAMGLMEKAAWSIKTLRPSWDAFSNYLRRVGGKALPQEVKGSRFGGYAKRFLELIGGGNSGARRFTSEMGALKDLIYQAQAKGDIGLAKELTKRMEALNGVVRAHSGSLLFGKGPNVAMPGNGEWHRMFYDRGTKSVLDKAMVGNELNKVKWARRGGMAALAAPVALPMASSVLGVGGGGGGQGYSGYDDYGYGGVNGGSIGNQGQWYRGNGYGNVPMYR